MENTLIVYTESKAPNWLPYILREFEKIQLPKFKIEARNLAENPIDYSQNYFLYTEKGDELKLIPNKSQCQSSSEVTWVNDDIFVLDGTQSNTGICEYDILWNAFVFLSRKEEYYCELDGTRIYSYAQNHPRKDKSTFLIPIVNNLFNEFEHLIKKAYPNLIFENSRKPTVELSHDLDYINKTIQLRLKQSAFNAFNTVKSIGKPSIFGKNLKKAFSFFFSNPSYWCFDYWRQIESNYNFKSVFYIYSKTSSNGGFKSWLIDPSYDISKNKKLQNELKEMALEGWKIGLHGSYKSALDFNQLKLEKESLQTAVGFNIEKTRQHWLNFTEEITPQSHSQLFKEDSTLAWNDTLGFRAGTISKFTPYDHKNDKPFDYEEIPQVIMDSNLYDYSSGGEENAINEGLKILEMAKNYKNAFFSISWHPRTCSSDYNWHKSYELYLQKIAQYESI